MNTPKSVNSWVFDGTAPGMHLPKLSIVSTDTTCEPSFKNYLNPSLIKQFALSGVINVPQDVDTLPLAMVYWVNATGAVHTIVLAAGTVGIAGEYLRIGHAWPLTLRGDESNRTMLQGGLHVMAKNKHVVLSHLTISSQSAASSSVPRHGLFVDNHGHVVVKSCNFVGCGGSGVCCKGKGSEAILINCSATGNKFCGVYAVGGGHMHLEQAFAAKDNGQASRGCQIESSGEGSCVSGCGALKIEEKLDLVGNTVVCFDRCLGRNKSFVVEHTRERYGGKVV